MIILQLRLIFLISTLGLGKLISQKVNEIVKIFSLNYLIGSIDYYYCFAKYSQAHQIVDCLSLDPAKTNLLYFASEFAPGVVDDSGNNNNNEGN